MKTSPKHKKKKKKVKLTPTPTSLYFDHIRDVRE